MTAGTGDAEKLLDGSMADAALRLRAGNISARAITEAALARAEKITASHNAFLQIWTNRALARADALDALPADRRGPLHGIPMAHKDCFVIDGYTPTVGSIVDLPRTARGTASAIERLEAAGSITIGTLHLSEMVAGPTGQNPHFGDCLNAWNPDYISGGSSSGSAVAVASGVVFASLGSDTGGSIRLPASANGCVGLKPTYGLAPADLTFPRAQSLDCVGPLTRNAQDAMTVTSVIAGSAVDERDAASGRLLMPTATRIGVIAPSLLGDLDAPIADAWGRSIALLGERLTIRENVDLPHLALTYALGDAISKVEAATLHARSMARSPQSYSKAVYTRTEPGFLIPAQRYAEALTLRGRILRNVIETAFAKADVLVCPTIPVEIPNRVDADMERGDAVFEVVAKITRLTRPFSYLGLPVASIPIGVDGHGLPIGMQIVGKPHAERRILAVARWLMSAAGAESAQTIFQLQDRR
ncbi:amidase [Fodinicurvata sp. EGI_FJ10296]|uniref:amidase n=1 Tax=Fodinicurvata sp. EGI_FJ10296 TaxID=3231908 RepID=UPI003451B067